MIQCVCVAVGWRDIKKHNNPSLYLTPVGSAQQSHLPSHHANGIMRKSVKDEANFRKAYCSDAEVAPSNSYALNWV